MTQPYYEDESVTIYHGDVLEVLPTLDVAAALLIADPPYGMKLDTDNTATGGVCKDGKYRMAGRKWEAIKGDDQPFDPTHLLAFPRVVIWGANHFASRLPESNGWIVWNKRGDGAPSKMHFGDCELAWSNVAQGIRMFSNLWHGAPKWRAEGSLHPTQKPTALMRWLIESFAADTGVILEPYMGSGPALRAAKDLGRKAIGIEIEERYCEVAAKRMAQEVLAI